MIGVFGPLHSQFGVAVKGAKNVLFVSTWVSKVEKKEPEIANSCAVGEEKNCWNRNPFTRTDNGKVLWIVLTSDTVQKVGPGI